MKPFRRTQVITFMAACAISTVWAQTPDEDALRMRLDAARQKAESMRLNLDEDALRVQIDAARIKAEAMRLNGDDWRDSISRQMKEFTVGRTLEMTKELTQTAMAFDIEGMLAQAQAQIQLAQDIAPKVAPVAPMAPMPPMPPKAFQFRNDSGSYESGKSALDNHNYQRAVEIFDRVINGRNPSSRADGAYYWKAYALNKLGKRDEALAALAELSKQFPQSSWLNDAKALQAEVQQGKGQPVSPEDQANEDLKLYAINALSNSDPERAVPLLEGLLSNPKMSPRLKEKALFVLAQSRSDKAREIVGRYAKSGSNPDLQLTAVQYLGTYRSKDSRQLLSEVYASVSDVNVKRAVLRSFEMSRDTEHLCGIAKSEQNVDLRREAIRQLGNMHEEQAQACLVATYGSESDKNVKTDIINSLGNQQAAKAIIDCARKETDPELKKAAVRRLSEMRSKEATDFLMEILK